MSRCKDCKFWKIAETRHGSPRADLTAEALAYLDDDERRGLKPHANLDWAECEAAIEGFDDDAHDKAPKMAVFDGSGYMANLWTRHDHICGEFRRREI